MPEAGLQTSPGSTVEWCDRVEPPCTEPHGLLVPLRPGPPGASRHEPRLPGPRTADRCGGPDFLVVGTGVDPVTSRFSGAILVNSVVGADVGLRHKLPDHS